MGRLGAPWVMSKEAYEASLTKDEIIRRILALHPGVLARQGTSSSHPPHVPSLIGIEDIKYLDATWANVTIEGVKAAVRSRTARICASTVYTPKARPGSNLVVKSFLVQALYTTTAPLDSSGAADNTPQMWRILHSNNLIFPLLL